MFVANNFLPDRTVLQWHPAASKDLPTLKTNEIVVFSVDSLTTIRLNYSISTLIRFFKSPSSSIFVKHFLAFRLISLCSRITFS
jgi:hypothetical protein